MRVLWPGGKVPVCVEDSAASFPHLLAAMKTAIDEQYNARTIVKAFGWGPCTPDFHGLRVTYTPSEAFTGNTLYSDGARDTVVQMNFDFNLSPSGRCPKDNVERLKNCAATVFLHEFGHVLGFAHEHDHHDAACTLEFAPPAPAVYIVGDYDGKSIMDYCWVRSHDYGAAIVPISEGDVATVNWLYARAVAEGSGAFPDLAPENYAVQNFVRFGMAFRPTSRGYEVRRVDVGGNAATAGLEIGDVIKTADDKPMRFPVDFGNALKPLILAGESYVTLSVARGDEVLRLELPLAPQSTVQGGN